MGLKDAAELEQLKNTHKKPTPKHPTNQLISTSKSIVSRNMPEERGVIFSS